LFDEVAGASPVKFALLGGGSRTVWSLAQARVVISDWKADYNHRLRHSALGYQAPTVYAAARTHQ
jgi:transposase InsO family protein